MSEPKSGFESNFSRFYAGDRAQERYERIRMAIFSPDYLISHRDWNDEDFTTLLDCIVALLECPIKLKRLVAAINQYSITDPNNSLSVAMHDAIDTLSTPVFRKMFVTRLVNSQQYPPSEQSTPGPSPGKTKTQEK